MLKRCSTLAAIRCRTTRRRLMPETFKRLSGAHVELPLEWGSGGFRTVSDIVRVTRLAMPQVEESVFASWALAAGAYCSCDPGDVVALATLRANGCAALSEGRITPVPGFADVWQQVVCFGETFGMGEAILKAEPVLLAIQAGAHFHHDGDSFESSVFCVVWLEEYAGLELVFPHLEQRIPLERGTVILFDAGQPHGVVDAGKATSTDDMVLLSSARSLQFFLSFDIEVVTTGLASVMGFELRTTEAHQETWGGSARLGGKFRGEVCPVTGAWE